MTTTQIRWQHQRDALRFVSDKKRAMIALPMRAGKTRVAIDYANTNNCNIILVMCPKAVIPVWPTQFILYSGNDFSVLSLDSGTTKQRTEQAIRHLALCRVKRRRAVIVINHESAWRKEFGSFALSTTWDLIIIDESHRGKDPNGRFGKFIETLGLVARRKLCLTGTPMPHSPLDVFSQYRFLDRSIYGRSYHHFKMKYDGETAAIAANPLRLARFKTPARLTIKQVAEAFGVKEIVVRLWEMGKSKPYRKLLNEFAEFYDHPELTVEYERWYKNYTESPKFQNLDELEAKFFSLAFHVPESDLDLPESIFEERFCELSPKAMKLYCQLETEFFLQVEAGEINASNALARSMKLRQMVSGFIYTDEKEIEFICDHKKKAFEDLLQDVKLPIVVACEFIPDLDTVGKIANDLGLGYGEVSGRMKTLTNDAKMPDTVDIMGVIPKAGALGIDLSRASISVMFSMGWSLGDHLQFLARTKMIGQKKNCLVIGLITQNTIEPIIYDAVKRRKDIVDSILESRR